MRSRDRCAAAALGGLAAFALGTLASPAVVTYASWSDTATIPGNHVGAGVWLGPGDPALPAQCAGMVFDRIIIGTNKSNVLTGTEGNDLMFGGNGQDTIRGLGGDDCIVGQNGKDVLLVGGPGDDVLIGGNGRDRLYGGTGNDKLYGDNAPDYLYGGDGLDVLVGGNAPDTEFQDGPNEPASTSTLRLAVTPTATPLPVQEPVVQVSVPSMPVPGMVPTVDP